MLWSKCSTKQCSPLSVQHFLVWCLALGTCQTMSLYSVQSPLQAPEVLNAYRRALPVAALMAIRHRLHCAWGLKPTCLLAHQRGSRQSYLLDA